MEFRNLKPNEIECRVSQVSGNGVSLLLYKDARVDQKLLDEKFGIFGWQRHHELINGNLFCTVSVRNPETGEWVEKQDVGKESYTEKEKGQASDAFKRACFNLGIGRELYSSPRIFIKKGDYRESAKKDGTVTTYDNFEVREIGYNEENEINYLIIWNATMNKMVFSYKVSGDKQLVPAEGAEVSKAQLTALKKELKRVGSCEEELADLFGIESLTELSQAKAVACIDKLRQKKDGEGLK
jgi:hypothetical protein